MNLDSEFEAQKKKMRWATVRFGMTIFILMLTGLVGFFYHRHVHQKMTSDYRIINLSGRQRMLSQRILVLSQTSEFRNDQNKEELFQRLNEFKDGLEHLVESRFNNLNYPQFQSRLLNSGGLKEKSLEFIKAIENHSTHSDKEILLLGKQVLDGYDEFTYQIQKISEAEYFQQGQIELVMFIIVVSGLIFEILGFFRPMTRGLKLAFNQLEVVEQKVKRQSRLALIGEAIAMLGHEIANPLSVISSANQVNKKLLAENPQDPFISRNISLIQSQIDKIARLIHSVATQARDSKEDQMVLTEASELISNVLEMFDAKIKEQKITVIKNIDTSIKLNCRPAAFCQVIANLLANALDAVGILSPEIHKTISMELAKDDDNKQIFLRIWDNGRGVLPEIEKNIFDKFVTTKEFGKGTGIGLSLSKKIVNEHGGQIFLNTNISRSCFEIRLPIY